MDAFSLSKVFSRRCFNSGSATCSAPAQQCKAEQHAPLVSSGFKLPQHLSSMMLWTTEALWTSRSPNMSSRSLRSFGSCPCSLAVGCSCWVGCSRRLGGLSNGAALLRMGLMGAGGGAAPVAATRAAPRRLLVLPAAAAQPRGLIAQISLACLALTAGSFAAPLGMTHPADMQQMMRASQGARGRRSGRVVEN